MTRLIVCIIVAYLTAMPFLVFLLDAHWLYCLPAFTGAAATGAMIHGVFFGFWPVWADTRHGEGFRFRNREVVLSILGQVILCGVLLYFLFPDDVEHPARLIAGVLAGAAYVGLTSGYLLHWLNRS